MSRSVVGERYYYNVFCIFDRFVIGFVIERFITMGSAVHTSLGSGSEPQWESTTIEDVPHWDLPCIPPWVAVVNHNGNRLQKRAYHDGICRAYLLGQR